MASHLLFPPPDAHSLQQLKINIRVKSNVFIDSLDPLAINLGPHLILDMDRMGPTEEEVPLAFPPFTGSGEKQQNLKQQTNKPEV